MKISFILTHITLVQGLKEADYPKRMNFCRFVREQIIFDHIFLENVLFSNEASFSNNGGVNKYKCHYYAQNNTLWIREGHFQTIYSTKCLLWNIGEQNYRTIFFRERLNGLVYLNFQQNILPEDKICDSNRTARPLISTET
jgi:hypothetical protein